MFDEIYNVDKELPPEGEWVLAYFPAVPWDGGTDNANHKWVVVRLIKGISKAERRKLLKTDDRKDEFRWEDQDGNNKRPYGWESFGADEFCGQEASCWTYLPKPFIGKRSYE